MIPIVVNEETVESKDGLLIVKFGCFPTHDFFTE